MQRDIGAHDRGELKTQNLASRVNMSAHVWNVSSEDPTYGGINTTVNPPRCLQLPFECWRCSAARDSLVKVTAREISTDTDAVITTKENTWHKSNANNILSPGLQRRGGGVIRGKYEVVRSS